jgi:phosphoribosylformylglycinamidine synthase subunit PurS
VATLRARVHVTLKPSVFDPQGKTIHEALVSLGHRGVRAVRQGKFFELTLEAASEADARAAAEEIARKVLSNPVIESFTVDLEP